MDVPELVRERLGGEQVVAGTSLGDEDALLVTATRALLYRGEGLLSDEAVEVFPLDVTRLSVSEGRRKTKFVFESVEGTDSFTVPDRRAGTVLEQLMGGILDVAEVTGDDEEIAGVFRFSELTLVVTDDRLVKHVGAPVWDEDYEEYPFDAVTGLDFEEGSVATQIVLSVDGRPQRIKAPTDEAPKLRETLQRALFRYHGVESLDALNDAVGPTDDGEPDAASGTGGLDLDDGIDPLVGGSDAEEDVDDEIGAPTGADQVDASAPEQSAATESVESARPDRIAVDPTPDVRAEAETDDDPAADDGEAASAAVATDSEATPVTRDDLRDVAEHVADLEATVEQQTELLRKQHDAIQQLIAELRQGR